MLTLINVATLSASCIGPDTGSRIFIEMQSGGTGNFCGVTLDAVKEHITDGGIGMREESVPSWTLGIGFWRF